MYIVFKCKAFDSEKLASSVNWERVYIVWDTSILCSFTYAHAGSQANIHCSFAPSQYLALKKKCLQYVLRICMNISNNSDNRGSSWTEEKKLGKCSFYASKEWPKYLNKGKDVNICFIRSHSRAYSLWITGCFKSGQRKLFFSTIMSKVREHKKIHEFNRLVILPWLVKSRTNIKKMTDTLTYLGFFVVVVHWNCILTFLLI